MESELRQLHELVTRSFFRFHLYSGLTWDDFLAVFSPWRPWWDPQLVLFAAVAFHASLSLTLARMKSVSRAGKPPMKNIGLQPQCGKIVQNAMAASKLPSA